MVDDLKDLVCSFRGTFPILVFDMTGGHIRVDLFDGIIHLPRLLIKGG